MPKTLRHYCGHCQKEQTHEVTTYQDGKKIRDSIWRKQPAADMYRLWEEKEISGWPQEMKDKYRFESDRFTDEEVTDLTVKECRCRGCGTLIMVAKFKRFPSPRDLERAR